LKIREVNYEKASRKDFAKVGDYIEMPNLIKVQKDSYDWFVEVGLGEVLKDISPIEDYSGNLVLEFFDYFMEDKTKYSVEEAKKLLNKHSITYVSNALCFSDCNYFNKVFKKFAGTTPSRYKKG
jgi:DNA-directed RNA polymerase beta subunit